MIDLTDSTSESWPVTTGVSLPAWATAAMAARPRVSFGDRMPSSLASRVEAGEHGVHALLRVLGLPALRGDLLERGLTRDDREGAVVDLRLQDAHRTLEERRGVRVVGRAGDELDVVRALTLALGETLEQRGALEHTDLVVVEGDVHVDGLGVLHQAVVGDDLDARGRGGLELAAQLRAVDGADDDDLRALLDHGLDLVLLLGHAAVGELDERLEPGSCEVRR